MFCLLTNTPLADVVGDSFEAWPADAGSAVTVAVAVRVRTTSFIQAHIGTVPDPDSCQCARVVLIAIRILVT